LGRVFQRLYHADRTIIPGLGDGAVGLSLVKALSEALGGRVWVESEVGKGSTFTVLLPLADAAARPAPPEAAQPPPDPPATVD
jgi:signal transduction histidine kinase